MIDYGKEINDIQQDIQQDIKGLKDDFSSYRQETREDLSEIRTDVKSLLSQTSGQEGRFQTVTSQMRDVCDWRKTTEPRILALEAASNLTKGKVIVAGSVATVVAGLLAALLLKLVS